jgi:hypothetical protein
MQPGGQPASERVAVGVPYQSVPGQQTFKPSNSLCCRLSNCGRPQIPVKPTARVQPICFIVLACSLSGSLPQNMSPSVFLTNLYLNSRHSNLAICSAAIFQTAALPQIPVKPTARVLINQMLHFPCMQPGGQPAPKRVAVSVPYQSVPGQQTNTYAKQCPALLLATWQSGGQPVIRYIQPPTRVLIATTCCVVLLFCMQPGGQPASKRVAVGVTHQSVPGQQTTSN